MIIFVDILKFILLVMMTFFACQVITQKRKRISFIGTMLICFSIAILQYINLGLPEAIFFGEMIFVSIDKLLENNKFKYLFAILIPIGILGFLLLSNTSFQVPVGITMIVLIIWRLLQFYQDKKEQKENLKKINKKEKTKEENKLNKRVLITLILGILISLILSVIFYRYNPIRTLDNKSALNYLTSYSYNMFVLDKPYITSFMSVFPIGLLIGIYYIFKDNSKHLNFMLLTVITSILELIIVAANVKFAFLPNYIFILGFSLLQIYMIVYIFANLEDRLFNLIKSAYTSLICLVLLMFMPIAVSGLNKTFLDLSYIIFVLEAYIVLNYSDKRFWRLGSWVFTIICISQTIGYLIVNFV